MPLLLELNSPSKPWVDLRGVSIDLLARANLAEAAAIPIWVNGREVPLVDCFNVSRREIGGDVSEIPSVIVKGDLARVHGLGVAIRESQLIVDGDVGDSVGSRLNGGAVYILGNAGRYVAEDMKQGIVCVFGDCGDNLAGPSSGRLRGLEGGDMLVYGSVGERAFHRMRRGTAFINGNVGAYGCCQMIAGTVAAMGNIGASYCQGMRRGSLVVSKRANLGENDLFTEPKPFELSFLSLLWRHIATVEATVHRELAQLGYAALPRLAIPADVWVHRRIGDLQVGGRGEIITLDYN